MLTSRCRKVRCDGRVRSRALVVVVVIVIAVHHTASPYVGRPAGLVPFPAEILDAYVAALTGLVFALAGYLLIRAAIDFETLRTLSTLARDEYGLAGAVQHGASTLPDTAFDRFPKLRRSIEDVDRHLLVLVFVRRLTPGETIRRRGVEFVEHRRRREHRVACDRLLRHDEEQQGQGREHRVPDDGDRDPDRLQPADDPSSARPDLHGRPPRAAGHRDDRRSANC